jgi:hypothetical protein
MRLLMLAALVGLATATAAVADPAANKQLYCDFIENVFNKRQPSVADRYVAVDFVEHNPNLPQGLAGKKQFVASVLAGFSDYHGDIQDVVAEGDKLVARVLWTGRRTARLLACPPPATSCVSPRPISFASTRESSPSTGMSSTACRAPSPSASSRRRRRRTSRRQRSNRDALGADSIRHRVIYFARQQHEPCAARRAGRVRSRPDSAPSESVSRGGAARRSCRL